MYNHQPMYEAYQGGDDITVQSLVQQVTYSTMPVKIILMCQLYAGMGTSCTRVIILHSSNHELMHLYH